jgi:hypothetical protein
MVPAKDSEASVGATVTALLALVDEVLVVDDGSSDATSAAALAAGARVLRLPANVGKGGAVAAGVAAVPDAEVYLLIDADVGDTAAVAGALLGPVVDGSADMTVGVLPSAGTRGGFGKVRDLARRGIRRGSGFEAQAPLSGQRAVRGPLLRSLELAPRFGLETGLTIDAVRAGARVVEVDVPMEHRHTGRTVAGFRHRARQGRDVVRALWPRLTSARGRMALWGVVFVLFVGGSFVSAGRALPSSVPLAASPSKVVLVGIPDLGWSDVGTGAMPALDGLIRDGAVAATSVRTLSSQPTSVEGYATLGAGARVRADQQGGLAFDADETFEGASAADALARRVGGPVAGDVVVVGAPAVARLNRGKHLPSEPGALGAALHRAGKRTAVVGNADIGMALPGYPARYRPVALGLMDGSGAVDLGTVRQNVLAYEPEAPFGRAASLPAVSSALDSALAADVVLVDTGDMDRAGAWAAVATPASAASARRAALQRSDELVAAVRGHVPEGTLVLVVSVTPPGSEWHTTPMVAWGAGVRPGYLHSPSVRRLGVVTLTDVAPTVLAALRVPVPDGMIGHALRYRAGGDLEKLRKLDRDAAFRERIYFPITLAYIIFQAIVYLLTMVSIGRFGGVGRAAGALRWIALGIAAWPLATFVLRAIPNMAALGPGAAVLVLLAVDLALVALALWLGGGGHVLRPLSLILGMTVGLIVVDVALGARLQTSSMLGYSLHTAARFTGLGNTAFAVLAASALLWGAAHVEFSLPSRRTEALWAVALVFGLVVVFDGAPNLGDDVGGILTLVPVMGLALLALSGRRVRLRSVVVFGLVALFVLGLAVGLDLLRAPESRTHLGQLVTDMRSSGSGSFTTTVARKLSTNLRTYKSIWLWVIVIVALYLLFFVVWGRGWSRLAPAGSALRVGLVAVLVAGLAGNFLNDSGAVVTALVFVYLGPFLTMLALARERGSPELLSPELLSPELLSPGGVGS